MPGPKKGTIRLTQEHRDKIAKSKILQRLIAHAEGDEDMRQTEVNAGIALLKKYLPDLSATELTATVDHTHTEKVESDAKDFRSRIAGIAARADAAETSGKPH